MLKDRKTKITFHSGVLTIGGTVVEIAYGDDHIFFDFGTEFKPELNLKDDQLETLLENRLVPELDFVYDHHITGQDFKKNTFKNTAVFISHCHLDHTRMLNYVDESIPVYMLKETKVLLESLNTNNDFLIPKVYSSEKNTRDLIGVNNKTIIEVGMIKVELNRVDHDAYGACGLSITTPDTTIAYTGDLRLHGYTKQDTIDYCERNKEVDVLIMEGVSVSWPDEENETPEIKSEQELVKKLVGIINENPMKQITFNCYYANVERILRIIDESPRPVVVEASLAKIIKDTSNVDCLYYDLDNYNFNVLDKENKIDYQELLDNSSKYLWHIERDFENLSSDGIYIHSDATPLGAFDPNYQPFIDFFEEKGIELILLRCSGHAFPEDLDMIIKMIQPKLLVPIHTLHPELLENPYGERHLPTRGETI